MKRKLTALALALGLTLSLAACGGGTTSTADTPAGNSESPAAENTAAQTSETPRRVDRL